MMNVLYRPETFSFYAYTDIERHLEKMAKKGWMLEKIMTFAWKYRRITPRELHFSVNYFPTASQFDPQPSDAQKTFQDFCEEAGWKLVATNAQMQIFCNEAENPVPIETDAKIQLDIIQKSMKKNYINAMAGLFFLGLIEVLFLLFLFSTNPVGLFTSSASLFSIFCWFLVMFVTGLELITYFRWLDKAEAAAKLDGSFIESHGHTYLDLFVSLLILGLFLAWVCPLETVRAQFSVLLSFIQLGILYLVVWSVKILLKRKNVPATTASTIVWISCFVFAFLFPVATNSLRERISGMAEEKVNASLESYEYNGSTRYIYQDELPIYIEDFFEIDYEKYSRELHTQSSWFMTQSRATERAMMGVSDVPNLSYTLVTGRISLLTEYCYDLLVKKPSRNSHLLPEEDRNHYEAEDPALWNADQAYLLYIGDDPGNTYLIRWGNAFLQFQFSEELTPYQKQIISQKMGNLVNGI